MSLSSEEQITSPGMKQPCRIRIALVLFLLLLGWPRSVRANVYATDIRLNGSFQPVILLPGRGVTISYILNETATGGVLIQIDSGTNVIATLSSTNNEAGTNAGMNSVVWDGRPDNSTNLAEGTYTVSITAAATGFDSWTNVSVDSTNVLIQGPGGITVDCNSNSPYYGRVFVADALNGSQDEMGASGIYKFNADGSPADEGDFATGGHDWGNSGYAPWKMVVGPDDRLYVDDFTDQGVVYSFDPLVDTNGVREVLSTTNYPSSDPDLLLGGLALTEIGTNTVLWMSDENPYYSAGILSWQLNDGVTSTNDTGTVIVPLDTDFLTQSPYDFALGTNGFIYTIQYLTSPGPDYALMEFPPYQGSPVTAVEWAEDIYPETQFASGVAVDPAGNYLAVAALGSADVYDHVGGLYVFDTKNGDFVANVDENGGDPYYDAAWDNVGNLYALDGGSTNLPRVWRVFSPPGANLATTVAVPVIQAYDSLMSPSLVNCVNTSNQLCFALAGQSNITYFIQQSSDLTNWTAIATNYSTNATRNICVPASGAMNFYRAVSRSY